MWENWRAVVGPISTGAPAYLMQQDILSLQQKKQEQQESFAEMSIEEHMKIYEDNGVDHKEAMKLVAKERGISKRDVYQYLLDLG